MSKRFFEEYVYDVLFLVLTNTYFKFNAILGIKNKVLLHP